MATGNSGSATGLRRAAKIIVVGSVAFTFISYWRTAAVVLCDLSSTVYYIGGIVEQAVGPAAPWFILAVMLFSYAVRNVYIESCSMFIRGGVYRVVREAMGGFMGKVSVSALIFDYILTGPISSVSAGSYLAGLLLEVFRYLGMPITDKDTIDFIKQWGPVVFASAVTLYFFWLNLKGIHESSGKALKIMIATTIMALLIVGWSLTTLAVQGPAPKAEADYQRLDQMTAAERAEVPRNSVPLTPTFEPKPDYISGEEGKTIDPLGFVSNTALGERLRSGNFNWWHLIGMIGIVVAFGHSILAMSGEETLAQVYREVEAPKLKNFKKAAFIVFIYSLGLTSLVSFLAVLLIPDDVRMHVYNSNLIGGLSMHVIGPTWAKLLLNGFVVIIGAMILSGAVNTAIIGSNGVLNRVTEDGVLPDWLRKPHPRYGTTHRILFLILFLKLAVIIASRGNVILLGEAYAFGVLWSFVFMSAAMVILRFKKKTEREYRMPLNLRLGSIELPLGLIGVFVVLVAAALMNLLTKDVATVAGVIFTIAFLTMFSVTEFIHRRRRRAQLAGKEHEHVEQFNVQAKEEATVTPASLGLDPKPYLKLIAIRSPRNLFMLEKSLAETDPQTTNLAVMTAKVLPEGVSEASPGLDTYEQELMTAVVMRAERAGKEVTPLIVPTNNPLHAVLKTARDLKAQEIVMGASNKFATDMQLEEIEFNWVVVNGGRALPLSVRILGRDRDVYIDIAGGSRIPKVSERQARSVAELRAAGVGVNRVLFYHDGTAAGSDLFRLVLTMLDPEVTFDIAHRPRTGDGSSVMILQDRNRSEQLDRHIGEKTLIGDIGPALVEAVRSGAYDVLVLTAPPPVSDVGYSEQINHVLRNTRCPVFLAKLPEIPTDSAAE